MVSNKSAAFYTMVQGDWAGYVSGTSGKIFYHAEFTKNVTETDADGEESEVEEDFIMDVTYDLSVSLGEKMKIVRNNTFSQNGNRVVVS